MNIRNAYLDSVQVSPELGAFQPKASAQEQTGKNSFEAAFEKKKADLEYGKSKEAVQKEKTKPKPKDNAKRSSDVKEKMNAGRDVIQEKVQNGPVENQEAAVQADGAQNVLGEVQNAEQLVVANLANELGMTVEELTALLQQMGLTVQDLKQPENLNLLLTTALGVEDSVQLLSVPNLHETLRNLNEILGGLDFEGETQTTSTPLDMDDAITTNAPAKANTEPVQYEAAAVETAVVNGKEILETQATADEAAQNQESVQENAQQQVVNTGNLTENQEEAGGQGLLGENSQMADSDEAPVVVQQGETTIVESADGKVEIRQTARTSGADVVEQLIDRIRVEIRPGISEMRMQLNPEDLGTVTLKVVSENGILSAKFYAETEAVKETLESNLENLKKVLVEQGLDVASLSVSVGQEDTQERMEAFLREQEKSSRRIQQIISNIENEEEEQLMADPADPSGISGSNIDYTA